MEKIKLILLIAIVSIYSCKNDKDDILSYAPVEISIDSDILESSQRTIDTTYNCKNSDIYWYKNGTLENSNGIEWKKATEENKLATCAGYLFDMSKQRGINPSVLSNGFISSSKSLMNSLDEFYEIPENLNTNFNHAAMRSLLR